MLAQHYLGLQRSSHIDGDAESTGCVVQEGQWLLAAAAALWRAILSPFGSNA